MNLPNYFLADLSDLATLSHQLIADACETLKKNRERFLLPRSTESTIQVIASLARDWLDRDFPFRKMVLDQGPELTGFTRETLATGLNQFFAQVTRENLLRLVEQDLGNARRLDEFSSDAGELKSDRSSIARGPELIVNFTGGVIPNPTLTSMIIGLLSRSAQFFKCASGTAFIPRMFAHSLYMADRKFASCIEVAEWKGGTETLDSALFENANCVTATGSDETLAKIYSKVSPRTRFLGYGHKVSLGYVTREMLSRLHHPQLLQSAVDDIIAWNQLGCLSPHVIYVESGGPTAPHDFAEQLALALKDREQSEPRGSIANDASAAITGRRMLYETRSLDGDHTKIWQSEGSTAWTVVYEEDPQWQLSCLNRFIYVKAVGTVSQFLLAAAPVQAHLSTVGLAAQGDRVRELALEFSRFGATRICPLGQMQNPPLTWRHDGRPTLGDLVTWSDLEF